MTEHVHPHHDPTLASDGHHDRCAQHTDHALRCTCERENDWDRNHDQTITLSDVLASLITLRDLLPTLPNGEPDDEYHRRQASVLDTALGLGWDWETWSDGAYEDWCLKATEQEIAEQNVVEFERFIANAR